MFKKIISPKLMALQKTFRKLKKTFNNVSLPKAITTDILQKTNFRNSRFFKDRTFITKQFLFRKNYFVLNKFKKENLNYSPDGVLNILSKYFNVLTMSLERNEKLHVSFLQKSKKSLNNLYIRAKTDTLQRDNFRKWETRSRKTKNSENPFKSLNEMYNGTLEQKYYTESRLRTNKSEEIIKKKDTSTALELPPPTKCRLSCPLPPPEFNPEEKQEYRPSYQSPLVKHSNQPELFLPTKTPSLTRPLSPDPKHKKTASPLTEGLSISEKSYPFNTRSIKSQLYLPQITDTPKMKAILYHPQNSSFNYTDVNIPTHIFKDEVLIQVVYSGVNENDLILSEKQLKNKETPLILGQEISGRVYAAGSNVHHVKTDDHVAINPYTACLVCRYCMRGQFSSCLNEGKHNCLGIGKDGGWTEFVVVKKAQIHKIPENLGMDRAVLIQPLAKILSVLPKLNLSHNMDILIQGMGTPGFMWALALHFKGYRHVFVSDESEKKRDQFRNLNVNYPIVALDEIEKFSADVIIECSGNTSAMEKCMRAVNPNGRICFFTKPSQQSEIRFLPYEIMKKEVTIFGDTGNTFSFSNAVDLAATMGHKYLNFNKLGVKVFQLKDYEQAFELKRSGEVGKVVFKVGN